MNKNEKPYKGMFVLENMDEKLEVRQTHLFYDLEEVNGLSKKIFVLLNQAMMDKESDHKKKKLEKENGSR